jgi:hypothetical protein
MLEAAKVKRQFKGRILEKASVLVQWVSEESKFYKFDTWVGERIKL